MVDVSALKGTLEQLKTDIREMRKAARIAAVEAGEDAPATSPEAVLFNMVIAGGMRRPLHIRPRICGRLF